MTASPVIASTRLSEPQRLRAFKALERLSITHSLVYAGLLAVWLLEGPAGLRAALGWAHGLLWILMAILVLIAARKAIVSFRLAVLVVVIGGLGPFAGTAGFIWEGRRRAASRQQGARPEVVDRQPR